MTGSALLPIRDDVLFLIHIELSLLPDVLQQSIYVEYTYRYHVDQDGFFAFLLVEVEYNQKLSG